MKDLIGLLEHYFFDTIGIIVPGVVLVLLCLTFDTTIVDISMFLNHPYVAEHGIMCCVICVIFLYILGTIVKVVAIKFYSVLGTCIGKDLPNLFEWMIKNVKEKSEELYKYRCDMDCQCARRFICVIIFLVKIVVILSLRIIYSMLGLIKVAVTFQVPFCPKSSKKLYEACRAELLRRDIFHLDAEEKIEEEKEDHNIYKLSSVILRGKGIRSLFEIFLAKYNLFRSLAFIFLTAAIYSLCSHQKWWIVCIFVVIWYGFHYKFLRYWNLCGEDAVSSALVYLKTQNNN